MCDNVNKLLARILFFLCVCSSFSFVRSPFNSTVSNINRLEVNNRCNKRITKRFSNLYMQLLFVVYSLHNMEIVMCFFFLVWIQLDLPVMCSIYRQISNCKKIIWLSHSPTNLPPTDYTLIEMKWNAMQSIEWDARWIKKWMPHSVSI